MDHHHPISRTMQRATLLLEANWYQDYSDRALVRLQDLQRQVQELQTECHKMQAGIQELVDKAEERLQELKDSEAQEPEAQRSTPNTYSVMPRHQRLSMHADTSNRPRTMALRAHQDITRQIEQGRAQLAATLDRVVTLTAQQRQPEREMLRYRERFNSIMYRLAPPPRGRNNINNSNQRNVNGVN